MALSNDKSPGLPVDMSEARSTHEHARDRESPVNRIDIFYGDKQHEGKANVFLRPYKGPEEPPGQRLSIFPYHGEVIEQWHSGTMTMRVRRLPGLSRTLT